MRRLASGRSAAGELIWVALGQGAAALGSLVGVRVLTDLLPPLHYGELALGTTAAILVGQLLLGPLSQGALRYYVPALERREISQFLRAVARLGAIAIAGIGLLLLIALPITYSLQRRWFWLVLASFSYAVLQGMIVVLNAIQNAARNRGVFAFHLAASVWLRVGVALAFISLLGPSSLFAMLGYVAGSLLVLVSELFFFKKKIMGRGSPPRERKAGHVDWSQQVLAYSWPFAAWGLFSFSLLSSDRWALGILAGIETAGMYAALYQISAYPVQFLSNIAAQFLEPVIYSRAGEGVNHDRLRSADRIIVGLVAASAAGTALLTMLAAMSHHAVFRLLVAEGYRSVSRFMPHLVLGVGLFATAQAATLLLMIRNETRLLLRPKIGTAALGVFANFLGAYVYGLQGVIASQIVFSSIYLAWAIFLGRKIVLSAPRKGTRIVLRHE